MSREAATAGPTEGRLTAGAVIAAIIVVLDQATKLWADAALAPYRALEVFSWLNLTLSYNPGAAFSLLADQSGWQRWLFTGLALAVSAYLLWWLARLPHHHRWHLAGLSGVLGGAVGNVIDRLVHGYVIDFIDVHYAGWHYPAFNVADSAITVGVVCVVIAAFREQQ